MRNKAVQIPSKNRRICLGGHPGHLDPRQNAETTECRLRQLRHKVGIFNFAKLASGNQKLFGSPSQCFKLDDVINMRSQLKIILYKYRL